MIGLTGNIATGKSTVLAYLRHKGTHIIDADKLTHQAMQPGGLAYDAIVAAFGRDILAGDGAIDRAALGRVVFADPVALRAAGGNRASCRVCAGLANWPRPEPPLWLWKQSNC